MSNTVSPTTPTPATEVKPDAPVVPADKAEQKKTDTPAKA
jgi:hypothetical protein